MGNLPEPLTLSVQDSAGKQLWGALKGKFLGRARGGGPVGAAALVCYGTGRLGQSPNSKQRGRERGRRGNKRGGGGNLGGPDFPTGKVSVPQHESPLALCPVRRSAKGDNTRSMTEKRMPCSAAEVEHTVIGWGQRQWLHRGWDGCFELSSPRTGSWISKTDSICKLMHAATRDSSVLH